jgi:hypothetical protein
LVLAEVGLSRGRPIPIYAAVYSVLLVLGGAAYFTRY